MPPSRGRARLCVVFDWGVCVCKAPLLPLCSRNSRRGETTTQTPQTHTWIGADLDDEHHGLMGGLSGKGCEQLDQKSFGRVRRCRLASNSSLRHTHTRAQECFRSPNGPTRVLFDTLHVCWGGVCFCRDGSWIDWSSALGREGLRHGQWVSSEIDSGHKTPFNSIAPRMKAAHVPACLPAWAFRIVNPTQNTSHIPQLWFFTF